ncbi:MAG: redox-sensing transcriptional repressor Rex [SAR202 cluster bacterium]|nr:redox-sensing transcriptional repressor Rex [SAR202 cluster bacterium]
MEGQEANRGANYNSVPEVVITRLPQYIRVLYSLLESGVDVVSSAQLGEQLQVTPAQIRKDLSYLGRFGKQGRGYNIRYLIAELKQVLGLNKKWNACLVGVGRLGRAILSYPGFAPEGFEIVAAFDSDPAIVGQTIASLKVQPIEDLDKAIAKHKINIAIIAVPGKVAQDTIKRLTDCGLKSILNYAPVYAQVPKDVKVRNVDPVLALQSMTYYLVNRS